MDIGYNEEDEVLFVENHDEISHVPENPRDLLQDNNHEDSVKEIQNVSVLEKENASPSPQPNVNLDPVHLASILRDFKGLGDPLFKNLPEYMALIVKEMLESDFLLVLGKGLGLTQILNLFLAKVKQASPNALVLVLGRRQDEDLEAESELTNGKPGDELEDIGGSIGFGVSSTKRSNLYRKGGIYNITAPIAVVDILTGVLDCSTVSGLVIAHGERVKENSTAAFFIKLLRERNQTAFIKGLSDTPERLILPPALPSRLRTLAVNTVMLWPRFHLIIDRSLPKLDVEEIIIEQSATVRKQQALLSELMQAVLSDIKRRVPHLDVDYLAPALGPQQVHESPEQLNSMTNADAVLASPDLPWRIRNALQSVWHQLSRDGKRSVHSLGTLQQLQHTLTEFDALSFWSQLDFACRDITEPWVTLPAADALIAEARREAAMRRVPGKFPHLKELIQSLPPGKEAFVICDSSKTIFELHEYLSRSREEAADDELVSRAIEEAMRQADEEKAKRRAAEHAAKVNEGRPGRRRVRGGGNVTTSARSQQQHEGKQENEENPKTENNQDSPRPVLKRKYEEIDLNKATESTDQSKLDSPNVRANINFATYHTQPSLNVVKPDVIVMYDPNLQFTREIERYVATLKKEAPKPTVYFMYYQKSVEELQYLTEMRREKDAFSRLIREKGLMPMVLRDGEPTGGSNGEDIKILGDSRRSYQVSVARQRIVVDTREFRSALPFLIWQLRMDVVPVTLQVGDYILTPEVVVERKSVSDLISSFRDGRLYAQCESMQKSYKTAVLLIEFDNLSHFSMEPFKDIRSRQSADVQREIQDNICSLLLRFPKLKLIWSASPLHSAQIFRDLKELEPEPEPEECLKAGQSVLFDSVALSILEALPGITPRNSYLIAKKAASLAQICQLTRQEIIDALGPENGEKLYRFMHMRKP